MGRGGRGGIGRLAREDKFPADGFDGTVCRTGVGGGFDFEKSSRDFSALPKDNFDIILCNRPVPFGFPFSEPGLYPDSPS